MKSFIKLANNQIFQNKNNQNFFLNETIKTKTF